MATEFKNKMRDLMNMEKELIENTCINNVKDIRISEETKILMLCRARLSSVYNTAANVVCKTYGKDIDNIFEGFTDKFNAFDHKLMEVISTYIEVTSLNSNYTKI